MSKENSFPYVPKHALFNEHIVQPEIYNEYNHRLDRIVGNIREVIVDATSMKSLVLDQLQTWGERNDQNNLSVHQRIDELSLKLSAIETENNVRFNAILKILEEIKDRLTAYEVDPDFDENP